MSTAAPSVPATFRDSRSMWWQLGNGVVLLIVAAVAAAAGLWTVTALLGAFAVFEAYSLRCCVISDGSNLVLRGFHGDQLVRIADVARVDANFTGYVNRTPHLVMRSGDVVALTPFRCSTLLRSRSQGAESLAEHLGIPASDPAGPAFRVGWLACAVMIVVGVLFGLPLFYAGVAMLVAGDPIGGALACLTIGGVLCAGAVRAIGLQRARRRTSP